MIERLSNLKVEDYPLIEACFDEAFADYALKGKPARLWLRDRCRKNGVDLSASAAAWDGDRMVGFTLVGLEKDARGLAAYDSGTGIVPSHRGRGLAGRLFDFLLPTLSELGVARFLLEVLQENKAGVIAYKKAGFSIAREFDCFSLDPKDINPPEYNNPAETRILDLETALNLHRKAIFPMSWENSADSIARIPGKLLVLGVFVQGGLAGELIYHPESQWIHSLFIDADYRRKGLAGMLLTELLNRVAPKSQPKVVNVDSRDTDLAGFLVKTGFMLFTRQFEMDRVL
ncbi:GNAT family N-acetyltransferase [bacterium]|nr:GNAT family N-acetyltransferase [bacterium]